MDHRTFFLLFFFVCVVGIDASSDTDRKTFIANFNDTNSEQGSEGIIFLKVGSNYYLERKDKLAWIDAYAECRKVQSYLANFQTIDEMNTVIDGLYEQKQTVEFWVGATDVFEGAKLRWIFDGTDVDSTFLEHDKIEEELNINNKCMLFSLTTEPMKILFKECGERYGFLCQRNIPKGVTLTIWE